MDSHDHSNSGFNSETSHVVGCTPPEAQASKCKGKNKGSSGRKNMKWSRHEHIVFISCCAQAIAAGHREGKCFTSDGWEQIVRWLMERTGQEWTQAALLSHWKAMHPPSVQKNRLQRDLRCVLTIVRDTYNSDMYASTPTKMGRKGGFLSSRYGSAGPSNSTIPVSAEMSYESDGGGVPEKGSGKDLSNSRSGDKRKGSSSAGKQKKSRSSRDSLSESAHKLASLGENLRVERARAREICPSCTECIKELKSTDLLEPKIRPYNFALSFFTVKSNREGFAA